ncbi:hypothetical protein H257_16136 [Aphanomyces astaci]|uniref:HTH myb-type domain-containing protein n=1 Tax=Aphanomyces astaci TaxID=112090 RepID=W4FLK6_APHAT|nr:hypothetical protein H257_16136 [Aphanomyces astaci]ETV67781.1 hypothetical protein H257_16136 [Aphanomyces astaci]|eukprot:XP_009842774.1 hypothetical protein H257_16136 [Aphanomyces astaci]
MSASGAWSEEEHGRFLHAMKLFPRGPWKAIAGVVQTRNIRQTQTHAQKHREKLARQAERRQHKTHKMEEPALLDPSHIAFLVELYHNVVSSSVVHESTPPPCIN